MDNDTLVAILVFVRLFWLLMMAFREDLYATNAWQSVRNDWSSLIEHQSHPPNAKQKSSSNSRCFVVVVCFMVVVVVVAAAAAGNEAIGVIFASWLGGTNARFIAPGSGGGGGGGRKVESFLGLELPTTQRIFMAGKNSLLERESLDKYKVY